MDFAVWTENNHPGWPFEKVESLRNWSSWEPGVQGGGPRTAFNSLWDKSSWASPFLSFFIGKEEGEANETASHTALGLSNHLFARPAPSGLPRETHCAHCPLSHSWAVREGWALAVGG